MLERTTAKSLHWYKKQNKDGRSGNNNQKNTINLKTLLEDAIWLECVKKILQLI